LAQPILEKRMGYPIVLNIAGCGQIFFNIEMIGDFHSIRSIMIPVSLA
jgi:hypothetical protein